MKKRILFMSLMLSCAAQTAFSKEYICTPTSGARSGTYIIDSDSETLTEVSDFGNQTRRYEISNGVLTVHMFGDATAKYKMKNGYLRHISGGFNGDYTCEEN